jgi:predicted RNA binding protein YcfA (HicA-like mRNA interferase family)
MPPRVREAKKLLRQYGFTVERPGKGDHTVFSNPITGEGYALDGADSHELPRPVWQKLKKRFGIK